MPHDRRQAGRRRALRLLAALFLFAVPGMLGAQDLPCSRDDVEIRGVHFTGNRTFSDQELADGIVTTPSAWTRRAFRVFGTRRCLDSDELRLDVFRLLVFYRKHGFLAATVDTLVQPVGRNGVRVTFRIAEGPPVRLASLRVTGLAGVPDSARMLAGLPVAVGQRFDQYRLDSARVRLAGRLRDAGYPVAEVEHRFTVDSAAWLAEAVLEARPGKRARVGDVRVEVVPRPGTEQQIGDETVRRLLGVRPGAVYSERALVEGQRVLYRTDAYGHVEIGLDSAQLAAPGDSLVDVIVRLQEGPMHTVRAALGYGTLDCVRASLEYGDVNAFGSARRLEVVGRISKIGIGEPLDVAPGLCLRDARRDIYSDTLNYYAGVTLQQLPLQGLLTLPSISVYSERRSEYNAYMRTTPAALAISRTWERGVGVPVTATYLLEYGRTEAQPALLCAAFSLCTQEDRARVRDYQRLGVLSGAVTRDRSNDLVNPTRGSILRADVRWASELTGSDEDQTFTQLLGNASWYHGLGNGAVLAARLRVGAVLDASLGGVPDFVPASERLYAGGPSTVRGFRQNELGPIVYLARAYVERDTVVNGVPIRTFVVDEAAGYERVVPTGGDAVVVGNLELRAPSPVLAELLQLVVFTDVGQLWSRGRTGGAVTFSSLRWTPGVGVRARTPVGPIRVDVGYNPYTLPAGAIYFDAPLREGSSVAPLYCVSPGNTIPVFDVPVPGGGTVPQQPADATCAATYRPPTPSGFFRRLTLNLSIGQAF